MQKYLIISFLIFTQFSIAQDMPVLYFDNEVRIGYKDIAKIELHQNTIGVDQLLVAVQKGEYTKQFDIELCQNYSCYKIKDSNNEKYAFSSNAPIYLTVYSGFSSLSTSLSLFIYNKDEQLLQKSAIKLTVEEDFRSEDIFFKDDDKTVNNIYPNPVEDEAVLRYTLKSYEKGIEIVIQNVLGAIVSRHELSPSENTLKLNTKEFNPGVYFYTLIQNGQGLATKKLVIKK